MSKFIPSGPELAVGTITLVVGLAVWELWGRDAVLRLKAGF